MKEMIKFLVMDVDGTLTDGKIYMGSNGEVMKAFNIKDGCGIAMILPAKNIIPVIITARESKILENRCKEIKITEIHQGSKDKLQTLRDILEARGEGLDTVAYIGDDLPDLEVMIAVKKAGGVVLCPADAIPQIKDIADYVSDFNAGEGAVRDCIKHLNDFSSQQEELSNSDSGSDTQSESQSSEGIEQTMQTENNEPFPSAKLLLDCAKDEYEKELDRMQHLDTKASWFMYAILFIVTVFVPVIPFAHLKDVFYMDNTCWQKGIVCSMIVLLLIALVTLVCAFKKLYDGYKLRDIHRFKIEIAENIEYLKYHQPNIMTKTICEHYCKAVKGNISANDEKADKITKGLGLSAYGFLTLIIVAMLLVSIIGK